MNIPEQEEQPSNFQQGQQYDDTEACPINQSVAKLYSIKICNKLALLVQYW